MVLSLAKGVNDGGGARSHGRCRGALPVGDLVECSTHLVMTGRLAGYVCITFGARRGMQDVMGSALGRRAPWQENR